LIGGGASLLEAGSGGSTLIGGANFDYLSGGDPDDHGHNGDSNDWGQGNESGLGHDPKYQTIPMDTLTGGSGDDLLKVLHGDNVILAGAGHDTIYAGDGHDTIYGSTMPTATGAMDTIYLGTGNTSIQGGAAGAATIYAGINGNDTITGSATGQELTVYSDQSSQAIKTTTVQGGVTTITFKDQQSLALENLTIHFSNGEIFKV
jgi:Ca2+-binding RTX toxin-like protein